jgi:hypothetical protein
MTLNLDFYLILKIIRAKIDKKNVPEDLAYIVLFVLRFIRVPFLTNFCQRHRIILKMPATFSAFIITFKIYVRRTLCGFLGYVIKK